MKSCDHNHADCVVAYGGKECPLCKVQENLDDQIAALTRKLIEQQEICASQQRELDYHGECARNTHKMIAEREERIARALTIIGTGTDCQCQGEHDCEWCQLRKVLGGKP